jgi:hypothetical protein
VAASPTTCGENNDTIAIEVKENSHVFYALNNNNHFGSEASFNNLANGEHHIFVKNKEAFLDSVTVEIASIKALKIASIKSIQPSCIDSLGILEIIESSGENDLLYSIDEVYYQKKIDFKTYELTRTDPLFLTTKVVLTKLK